MDPFNYWKVCINRKLVITIENKWERKSDSVNQSNWWPFETIYVSLLKNIEYKLFLKSADLTVF